MQAFVRRLNLFKGQVSLQHEFSTFGPLCAVDKKALTSLRKKTGFSFTKCNEAIKMHNNDMEKAETWLYQQAEKEGWTKAKKLQNRVTSQGLVGVLADKNFVSLVEVACETDFVARNELFVDFVAATAASVLSFRKKVIEQNLKVSSNANQGITHLREIVMEHELRNFKHPQQDSSLEEYLVQLVGKIGENIKLKRALAIATAEDNIIGYSTHGNNSVTPTGCYVGSFAGVVVLKPSGLSSLNNQELQKLAIDLSKHVIGMNPVTLKADSKTSKEESLLGQEFLLNDKVTVEDLVESANVTIIDFVRYGLTK